jgi:type III restriction enzyme
MSLAIGATRSVVTVFNHDAWSGRLKHLVNAVLEIERQLSSKVDPKSPFNFDLHHLDTEGGNKVNRVYLCGF